ncbi:hypothetical protein [Photobacterium damselae]
MSIEKYSDEYIKATEIIINRLVEDTCCSIINDATARDVFWYAQL